MWSYCEWKEKSDEEAKGKQIKGVREKVGLCSLESELGWLAG
jgi:hypothetical protein